MKAIDEILIFLFSSFQIVGRHPDSIDLSWVKPTAEITRYTLRVTGPGGRPVTNEVLSADTTSYSVRNLSPGIDQWLFLIRFLFRILQLIHNKLNIALTELKLRSCLTCAHFKWTWTFSLIFWYFKKTYLEISICVCLLMGQAFGQKYSIPKTFYLSLHFSFPCNDVFSNIDTFISESSQFL